jgi:uncharacterized membrane protein
MASRNETLSRVKVALEHLICRTRLLIKVILLAVATVVMVVGLLILRVVGWVLGLVATYTLLRQYLSEGSAAHGTFVTVFMIGPLFIETAKEAWRREA